jgi:tellurite resistance protein TehA-like permease
MSRSMVNFILDLVAFLNLLCLVLTGFILKYILPPGSAGGYGRGFRSGRGGEAVSAEQIREFLSLGRHDWGDVHFYLALLFVVLMIIHIILHWTWIKFYMKSVFKR